MFTRNFRTPFTSTCIRNSWLFSCLPASEIPDPFHIYMHQKFQTLFLSTSEIPDPFHICMYQIFLTLFLSTCIRNSRSLPHLHVSDIPDPFPVYVYQKFQTPFTTRNSRPLPHLHVSEIPDPFPVYMYQKIQAPFHMYIRKLLQAQRNSLSTGTSTAVTVIKRLLNKELL